MLKRRTSLAVTAIPALVYGIIILGGLIGWVMNIVKLVGILDGEVTAMFIARIVGIVVAPLGAVLGYL